MSRSRAQALQAPGFDKPDFTQADFHAGAGSRTVPRSELAHAIAQAERAWGVVGMGALMAIAFGTNHHDVVMQVSGVALGAFSAVQVWANQKRLLAARHRA